MNIIKQTSSQDKPDLDELRRQTISGERQVDAYGALQRIATLLQPTPVEACQRCGLLLVRVGQSFDIPCAGSPSVRVHICHRCVRAGLGADERLEVAA
jgi:hypothetical protein